MGSCTTGQTGLGTCTENTTRGETYSRTMGKGSFTLRCTLEELRVVVANLDDWMPPPPWDAYCALMACA